MNTQRIKVSLTDRDHSRGWADAPLTILEYGDYESAACSDLVRALSAAEEFYGSQLHFVFRHFPVRQLHPFAERAARAAEAAGRQSKFWEMHELLMQHPDELDTASLLEYAQSLDLDMVTFERDLEDEDLADKITEDFQSAVRSGVHHTPTLFFNGERYTGSLDLESLKQAIGQYLIPLSSSKSGLVDQVAGG